MTHGRYRTRHKQGQVTLFIIIGIILIVAFALLFGASNIFTQEKGEETLKSQQAQAALIEPIETYVKDCLNLVAAEGLTLLGKQGGVLYKSQGGRVPDYPSAQLGKTYLVYDETKVPYAILRPTGQVGTVYYTDIPRYPWATFPRVISPEGDIITNQTFKGYFGKEHLPQLFPPYNDSIQEQLERYATDNVQDCTQWAQFGQQGLSIQIGTPNVSVDIQETTIIFDMNWPLVITSRTNQTSARIDEFIITYPLRFPQLYTVLNYAVSQDISHINFTLDGYQAGPIRAKVIKDIFRNDDVVIFEDTSSRIIDKTFTFVVGRQDRQPALVYIDPELGFSDPLCNGTLIYRDEHAVHFDNTCGPAIRVPLDAFDPDEDEVTYTFNLAYLNNNQTHLLNPLEAQSGSYSLSVIAHAHDKQDFQDVVMLTKTS